MGACSPGAFRLHVGSRWAFQYSLGRGNRVIERGPLDVTPRHRPAYVSQPGQTGSSAHTHGCNAAFADGSVNFLSEDLDAATAAAPVSKAGGDSVIGF